jgi:hypothetical protein
MFVIHMRQVHLSLIFASCIALTACMTPPASSPDKADPANVAIDNALLLKPKGKPVGPEVPVVKPMYGEPTSVSFLGDASTLLADAAKGRGGDWKFAVSGPQPRLPIYVQVHVKSVSFADFLKDVAEQLGQRADIALNGKTIELRYRANN